MDGVGTIPRATTQIRFGSVVLLRFKVPFAGASPSDCRWDGIQRFWGPKSANYP